MQLFTSHNINLRTGVMWITCGLLCFFFISCLDSLSDGTHSLQSIHWWAGDVMLHFSKSFLTINKLVYILDGLRVCKCLANFHFWLNYSFNSIHSPAVGHCSFLYIRELCSGLCSFLSKQCRRQSLFNGAAWCHIMSLLPPSSEFDNYPHCLRVTLQHFSKIRRNDWLCFSKQSLELSWLMLSIWQPITVIQPNPTAIAHYYIFKQTLT